VKLLDANIFIYASGGVHEYREACGRVVDAVSAGSISANVDIEVLQEILHLYHSRRETDVAIAVFTSIADAFREPYQVNRPIMILAAGILGANRHLQSRDAVHAAVVIENNLEGIISADRGFDNVPGLVRFDPLEFERWAQ
jgi:predicted nucleic acid-binding protein